MVTTSPGTTDASRRRTVIPASTNSRNLLSYLWLVLATVLLPFTLVRWTIPLAAWLVPVFLLRFARTQPVLRGTLLVLLANALAFFMVLQGVLQFAGALYYVIVLLYGFIFTLPYLIDRVVAPRLGGMLATLVFPFALTTVQYLNALLNPLGTYSNPAYTQYGNLPFLQLLSVTGLWGIILVMSWFASMVNWAWERGFAWPRVRGGAALYASLLALVLLFGGGRLALFSAQGSTVRVAGITPSAALLAARDQQLNQIPLQTMQDLYSAQATPAERQTIALAYTQTFAPISNDLFSQSLQEARAGARIIIWPECVAMIPQEEEAVLIARASALARTTGIYLDMGLCELLQHPVAGSMMTDETILIDPTGNVAWRYNKAHPVPGEPWNPGNGRVPTIQTPYGRLANVICFDGDFPATLRQAGQAGADIMLIPSGDWREIDPYHAQLSTFRAIENGYSLVRQTNQGLAITVDYEGQVLAASDYFTTNPQVMVAYVPMQGVHTIYATIGDLFAWLSLAGLGALIGIAIIRSRQGNRAKEQSG